MSLIIDYQRVIKYLFQQSFFTDILEKSLKEVGMQKPQSLDDKIGMYSALLDAHMFEPDEKGDTPI